MWSCAIAGCDTETERVEDLIVHQARDHERVQCPVCATVLPDGYFAIKHTFEEHTRTDFMRAYDAESKDIRQRESVIEAVESRADMDEVLSRLDTDSPPAEPHA